MATTTRTKTRRRPPLVPAAMRALSHPLRAELWKLLDGRTASPSELAAEVGARLPNVSYHIRQLYTLGLIELKRQTARRGAIEHHYTAKVSPREVLAELGELLGRDGA